MKNLKNENNPENGAEYSAKGPEKKAESFIRKLFGAGKRSLQRGVTLVEIVIVLVVLGILLGYIYNQVAGTGNIAPIRGKALLQNTKTMDAAVRRVNKYLGSTPMNMQALVIKGENHEPGGYLSHKGSSGGDELIFPNNIKGKDNVSDSVIGGWTGPYIEGVDIASADAGSGVDVNGGKLYYQDLKDVGGSELRGFLYVSDDYVYYSIDGFESLDDEVLKAYYHLCNKNDKTDADLPVKGTRQDSTKKCTIMEDTASSDFEQDTSGKFSTTKLNYVKYDHIKSTTGDYVINYRISKVTK